MSSLNDDVLIVGDFSGVGSNLVKAMRLRGYSVSLISDGDGYKKLDSVIWLPKVLNFALARYAYLLMRVLWLSLNRYRYVVFVTPFIVKGPALLCYLANKLLLARGSVAVFLACGSDYYWWNFVPKGAKRTPHLGFVNDLDGNRHRFASRWYGWANASLVESVDRIIALGFEYTACYELAGYTVEYCGFPVFLDENDAASADAKPNSRRYCYHGITRKGFKGSEKLIDLMRQNAGWGYEQLVTNRVTFKEFTTNLRSSVIYLDQWSSFGPAMSALQALQYCPVVISGVQQEYCNAEYFKDCPVIDPMSLTFNPELVHARLSDKSWPLSARDFLIKHHSPDALVDLIIRKEAA